MSKEEILKKGLCKSCDPAICHNNYDYCPRKYNPNAQLCLTCKERNNETENGVMKCYWTCPYKENKEKEGIEKWM